MNESNCKCANEEDVSSNAPVETTALHIITYIKKSWPRTAALVIRWCLGVVGTSAPRGRRLLSMISKTSWKMSWLARNHYTDR